MHATNDVVAALLGSIDGQGPLQSYWEGPRGTARYLYGTSAGQMRAAIATVLPRFPLAQGCRVVALPLTLPT